MEEYKEFVERIAEKSSERRASTEDLVKVKDDIVNKSWVFQTHAEDGAIVEKGIFRIKSANSKGKELEWAIEALMMDSKENRSNISGFLTFVGDTPAIIFLRKHSITSSLAV